MNNRNVKHSKVIIAVFCLSLAVFLASIGLNILFESSITPKGGVPEATNGISLKSLSGGGSSFIEGGKSSREIAAALTKKQTDLPKGSAEVMEITVFGEENKAAVTIFKAENGSLYSRLQTGEVYSVNAARLKSLLEGEVLSFLTKADSPAPILANGTEIAPYYYSINVESLFGSTNETHTADTVPTLQIADAAAPALVNLLPEDNISVTFADTEVFRGTADTISGFVPTEDGSYLFTVDRTTEGGTAQYRFTAEYSFTPIFSISRAEVPQGGVLIATVTNTNGRTVSAVTDFDYTAGMIVAEDSAWCYIPVSHTIPSGSYRVTLTCGDYTQDLPVTVTEESFEVQNLTISEETVSSTTGEDASAEFAAAMAEIYKNFDPNTYWSGTFQKPVEGTVTTEYGLYRYTNGAETPTRHAGIDIAADEGTPVSSPAAGKVIFSGHLTVSGNTVVIEHGNGLHSLFFHLQQNSCAVGDMVAQGDTVGLLGSTGYSSGPHLHYQLMIGDSSINPWHAFNGSSEFYRLAELGLAPQN